MQAQRSRDSPNTLARHRFDYTLERLIINYGAKAPHLSLATGVPRTRMNVELAAIESDIR